MPTQALLGATGATGSSILRALLANPPQSLQLNILVRSRSKLLKAFPDLESTTAFKLSITEGSISDTKAMASVLRGAEIVHMVVATNDSSPGVRIARDASESIIAALLKLRAEEKEGAYVVPTILVIRSCTLSPTFAPQQAWLMHKFVYFALYHCYSDLDIACQHYAKVAEEEPGLFEYVYVDPPGIHDSEGVEPTGHELLVDPAKKQTEGLNYADLGVAFVDIAARRKEFWGESVAVSATGQVRETWGVLAGYLASGLKGRIIG